MSESQFPYMHGYKEAHRDRIVATLVNWLIDTFASPGYQNFVHDLLTMGREEFKHRLEEERKRYSDEFLGDSDE